MYTECFELCPLRNFRDMRCNRITCTCIWCNYIRFLCKTATFTLYIIHVHWYMYCTCAPWTIAPLNPTCNHIWDAIKEGLSANYSLCPENITRCHVWDDPTCIAYSQADPVISPLRKLGRAWLPDCPNVVTSCTLTFTLFVLHVHLHVCVHMHVHVHANVVYSLPENALLADGGSSCPTFEVNLTLISTPYLSVQPKWLIMKQLAVAISLVAL